MHNDDDVDNNDKDDDDEDEDESEDEDEDNNGDDVDDYHDDDLFAFGLYRCDLVVSPKSLTLLAGTLLICKQ